MDKLKPEINCPHFKCIDMAKQLNKQAQALAEIKGLEE